MPFGRAVCNLIDLISRYTVIYQYRNEVDELDKKRREFFSSVGKRTAAVAAGVTTPALVHLNSLSNDLSALSSDLNDKIGQVSAEMKEHLKSLHNRLDGAALTMSHQQIQLYFIFLLLVLSFAVDAGMTTMWILT